MTWQILALEQDIVGLLSDDGASMSELEELSRSLLCAAVVIVIQPPGMGATRESGGAEERWFRCPTVLAAEGDLWDAALRLIDVCDITVMADDARLVATQSAGRVEATHLARLLPQQEMARMALLGRLSPLEAKRAAELGCIDEVVESSAVRSRALAAARRLSSAAS